MKKIELAMVLLLVGSNVSAKMASFELEKMKLMEIHNFFARVDFYLTNNSVAIPLDSVLDKKYLVAENKPKKEDYYVNLDKEEKNRGLKEGIVENCTRKSRSNGLLEKRAVWYECFSKEKFKTDLKEFTKTQETLNTLLNTETQINFNEFTPSLAKISFDITLKGEELAALIYKGEKDIKYLGVAEVKKCMDQYGEWFEPTQEKSEKIAIESLINDLLSSESREYVRCTLSVESVSSQIVEMIPVQKLSSTIFEVSRIVDELIVSNEDTRVNNIVYEKASDSQQNTESVELNKAVNEYVDFIRFEYGVVLSEIATNEMPRAQAQLKVQKFLLSNKARIRSMLSAISSNLRGQSFIDQMAVSFSVNRVYQSVTNLERRLGTTIKLDHITR